jgi:hypothetical protein
MQNDEEWHGFYETQAASLEPETLAESRSRSKRIRVGLKGNPEIAEFNPLTLWELHYLREFDYNGYNQPAVRVNAQLSKDELRIRGKNIKNFSLNNSSVVFIRIDS